MKRRLGRKPDRRGRRSQNLSFPNRSLASILSIPSIDWKPARWKDIAIEGKHTVRDVWCHKDLAELDEEFSVEIGRLGVELLRVRPIK